MQMMPVSTPALRQSTLSYLQPERMCRDVRFRTLALFAVEVAPKLQVFKRGKAMATFSNSPSVLIVEDEPVIRQVTADWLQQAGFRVFEAQSGEDAIWFLGHDEKVDVLFTDLRLGGASDGWDVAEAFREKYPELAVVYCSGYLTKPPRIVDGGLFLTKPYCCEEIIGACRKLTHVRCGSA